MCNLQSCTRSFAYDRLILSFILIIIIIIHHNKNINALMLHFTTAMTRSQRSCTGAPNSNYTVIKKNVWVQKRRQGA